MRSIIVGCGRARLIMLINISAMFSAVPSALSSWQLPANMHLLSTLKEPCVPYDPKAACMLRHRGIKPGIRRVKLYYGTDLGNYLDA